MKRSDLDTKNTRKKKERKKKERILFKVRCEKGH